MASATSQPGCTIQAACDGGWLWPEVFKNQDTSVARAKKAVADYKESIGQMTGLAELMVFFCCERTAGFRNDVGLQDQGCFDALVRMFGQALKVYRRLARGQAPIAQGSMATSIDVVYTSSILTFSEPVMSKEAVFTMKLEPELRDAFMAEAEASHRPASQVVRELMREFVERQRQAREYDAFLRAKVDTARAQIASGQVVSDADVEARSAARRAALRAKAGGAGA